MNTLTVTLNQLISFGLQLLRIITSRSSLIITNSVFLLFELSAIFYKLLPVDRVLFFPLSTHFLHSDHELSSFMHIQAYKTLKLCLPWISSGNENTLDVPPWDENSIFSTLRWSWLACTVTLFPVILPFCHFPLVALAYAFAYHYGFYFHALLSFPWIAGYKK